MRVIVSVSFLLISGDIESNPGPVAHGASTHTVLRNPSFYGSVAGSISSVRIEGTRHFF